MKPGCSKGAVIEGIEIYPLCVGGGESGWPCVWMCVCACDSRIQRNDKASVLLSAGEFSTFSERAALDPDHVQRCRYLRFYHPKASFMVLEGYYRVASKCETR